MEKNKNKCRCRITLLLGFIFSIIFSISVASALDNTYYWTPSSGAIGSSGYTADWGSCGQSPTTYRITTLSSTGFICNIDYLTTTSSGDQFLAIYPTAYSSDTTITGKTGATFYLSGEGRPATYRFDLGYAKNGAFTSLGYVTRSASSSGNLYTIDMSSITGTAPSGSYLALKVSVTSLRGGRIYLGTNGGVTGSNSGRFYVSENPLIPPTPSYNVTVTATPTLANTTNGNGYAYNIIVNNIGNTQGNYTLNLVDSDTVNFQSSALGTTSMQINSGGSANTTLTVSAKANGTIGAIDTTTVTVNSVENPIYTNSTQVSTTIVDTPPPPPTDYKIIVSTDRYSISSPWEDKANETSLSENFTAYALLLDNNGKPVSGQGITFKIYSGGGTVKATETSITQANGLASSVSYDAHNDFTGSADADYGTWKIEAYMTNSPSIISSANMEIQAGGNTLGGGCKANCHSTNVGTGGKPQSPYTDGYGQTSSRAVAAHKKVQHQSQGCYKCHPGYSEIKTGTYGNTSDVHKNMTCDNCHDTWASFGSSSGTGIPRMPSCYDCHPVSNNNVSIISTLANLAAGDGISVYSYNFDLNKPLAAHNGTMYSLVDSVPCIACHGPTHNISKPYVTSKNNVTENEQCWACHTNRATTHKSNTNCVGCHTQNAHNISIGGGGPLPPVTYIPADPTNLQNTTGNFWVNNTWLPGIGNTTDSYNVSVNGTWYNGTTNTFENTTTVPHGWVNITVWAYNSSGTGSLSAGSVGQNTHVPNNQPVQAPIGSKPVNEGQLLTFTVSATDIDNDIITYGTNATKGTLNTTTGQFSWTPGYEDAGVYVWYFNSSDSYGGVASETITVTVNNVPLTITSSSPASDPVTIQGVAQSFNVTLNRTANVIWYINGTQVQNNTSVLSADYTNSTANAGVYNVTASATDGVDSVSRKWNWTVNAPLPTNYVPPDPVNLQNTAGSFWVNHTWQPGSGNITNSYNLSVNGTWYNGTINTFKNTTAAPHSWVNITVWAYNSSGTGSLSTGSISQNTQVPNNPPVQSPIGDKSVDEGQWLTFTITATDIDTDPITYGTNATKGSLNTSTGVYAWQTSYTDAGTYIWYFNSSDGYGGIATETVTVTVNNIPLSITSSSPSSDPTTTQGTEQSFSVSLNRTGSVTWYMNGIQVQTNASVTSAVYTNSTAGIGTWNVTASATDGIDTISRVWNWTVISQPAYNVSGYVFDNYGSGLGDVQVQNGSKQSTTAVSGYYLITGLFNGTYNFSYSKAGFNTGYLEVTVNGADYTNANKTIDDTTPPTQITGLINDTPTQTTVNLTWNTVADANYYQMFRNSASLGYTQNNYWNDTGLTADTLYEYTVRANDSYNNWGQNSSILSVRTASAADTTPPASVSASDTATGNFYVNNTWTNPVDADYNYAWFKYSNGTTLTNVSKPASYLNLTWQPHYIQNISAQTVDMYGNINQTKVWFNTTIPNNAPFQYSIGNKVINENENLQFTVIATDVDSDTITYGTNATKGTFNTTTGNFSWIPGYGDAGVYVWYFNSSDGYGGVASENIIVTVNNVPLSITSSSPVGDPATTAGTAQTFGIALNRTANVTWYIDNSAVQTDSSITSANYTNSTAGAGTYNVTVAATDGYDSASKQWNWTVGSQPVYAPPSIISWGNNKTNNDSLTLAVNTSEPVNFNATANQTITTWNWYQNGVNQINNYDNLTTSWNTSGTKSIQVNATNGNGTSNTITWTVTVQAQPETYGPNCLDCHRGAE